MLGGRVDPRSGLGGKLTRGDQLLAECDELGGPAPDPALTQPQDAHPLAGIEQRQDGDSQLVAEHGPGHAVVPRHGFVGCGLWLCLHRLHSWCTVTHDTFLSVGRGAWGVRR